ncbi:MAG: branched-chain amino acid ABC transporter permease [Actinomycetota bacterium]
MKAVLIFGGFGGFVALIIGLERFLGDRLRTVYDRNERWLFPSSFGVFVVAALSLPLFLGIVQEELAVLVGLYALLALGLNVVVGFAGLLDLGYVAFWAIGAYSYAVLTNSGPIHVPGDLSIWQVLPIAVLIALFAGVILGAPTLRLRGDYLAIVTLGFGEIVRILAENLEGVTRGAKGIINIKAASVPFTGKPFAGDPSAYYVLTIIFLAFMILIVRQLNRSRVGRYWAAIREDEEAAEAMGVPTLKYKLWAFAIGASTSGFAGVVYAARVAYISPGAFQFIISITILAMVVLGGLGSIAGAMIGAAVITVFPEVLRSLPDWAQESRYMIFGAALVLMMIFRPQGLIPSRRRSAELKGEVREAVAVTPVVGEGTTDAPEGP